MTSQWIESRPGVLAGKPCIRGTRISVEFVRELVAGGATREEILAAYPQVSAEALGAALGYEGQVAAHDEAHP
jgi:uncharacterized protein (DUF433 family)